MSFTSECLEECVKQTLETLREYLKESEDFLVGKAFEKLKIAFLVMDMAAMVFFIFTFFFSSCRLHGF